MSLEDAIRRKLQEQKKDEQNEQDQLKQTAIQALRNQKAGKHVVQQTEPQKSGSTGMDFLQAGALKNIDLGKEFQDGYQFGDIAKTEFALKKAVAQTILGTGLDNTLNMWKGIGGTVEGVVDLGMYGVAGIQKATGHKEAAEKTKRAAQADFFGETVLGDALEFVNKSSVLGNTSKSIAAGIGQGALTVGLGMLTGGLSTAASTAITTGVTGLSSMGQGMTEAYEGNATDKEAALYGLISGVVDAGTELMTGGLGKGANAIGIGKGIGGIDDMIASGLTKNIKNKFAKNLAQMGVKAVGEGVEEALSYAGQTLAKQWTYLSEKELKELWSNQELLENFVVGTLTSAFMQAGDAADATAKGRDFVSGRTDAEQTVIDKLYKDRVAAQEKDGKKLTTKEKGQILDAVELEYERGEIAVEDIEAALGGDSYQKYTEMAKQQKDLQAEFDQLNGMKKSDMTGAQEDRLQELRQQLAAMKQEDEAGKLKKQYLQETMAKVTGSHLEESYNQYNQRSEYFQADLEKYDEKQRAIVQKAVDSGILNNTRKTHDFVDLVAKIGAETGTDFDFIDNKKLTESGFAVDGVTVNGFTDGKTVTVNIHSAKALNTVVGHEIMHVLEGTELAGKLQEKLFAYAESKGELAKRRGDLEKLYAGRDANIDSELAADLVGDYIFSDIDFVRSLKAGDRNLFQKIYDEIKHLAKLATAGSKEARELEKVKKLFADVYREAGAEKSTAKEGGVQYSLAKIENITPSNEQKKQNINAVANMKPVCRIDASKLIPGEKSIKETYQDYFDKWGGNIYSDLFGDVAVRNSSVRSEMRHGSTPVKVASIEAIPDVIQNGKIVEWIRKDSGLLRIIVAAPIEIGKTPYFMGVMLQRDAQNQRLYLHDVVIEEEASYSSQEHLDSTGPHEEKGNLYTSSILDKIVEVKRKMLPSFDNAYLRLVDEGDTKAAQKMVEKAAKEAGYTVKAYHGTDAGEFHEFDKGRIGEASGLSILGDGFYFSDRESTARQYGKNVFPVYLKQLNPYNATAADAYKLNALELERQGYDSVILQTGKGKVLMVLDPNQVKSAAPITYDKNGNVIPLSERFNQKSNDMRYSLSQEQMEAADTAYDPKQIYGKDVRMEAPVAAQTKTGVAGIEGPLPDQMQKAQPIEGPLRKKVKAAPAMEAPTAAEMPKAQTVEAPVQEAKEGAVETKAPKDGMEPVVSPKVYRPDEGKLKPKAEDMSQEEREYRDSMEDKPAETFRDVMEKRLQSLRREIEENRRNKQTVAEQYDEKIQSLKDEFAALKNKNTKHAQDILRSISRNQQLKEARMAEYDKRINDLTKRVQRTQERIDSDTGRADWKQGKLDKIDAKYEEELEALETRQKEQRRELETRTASKEQYFADRALELYDELSTLKKGVKASEDLAYFLDRGHTWNAIKSALLLVKDKPSGIANPHFGLEKIVRERLEQRYNDALAELADLDTQQAMDRKALEDAMKKEKATLQASQIKKTKMEQYQAESAELAGNTATWKDKKTGFGYSMQTMRRYLREVVRDENGNPDINRADAIYEYLQGTYNQNEAALKREAKKRKDQIRELGLNKYEDEYGAMLGELKYNPESQSDAELAYRAEEFLEAHKDKINLEKTNKAIEMLRSEYDELIELLNNALREQGFREIPYRKGYFPHFMEPSQNFVQKLLNWKPKNNEIPTSIAGMTEEFNPQRSWQGFDKERKGNATVYSLQKGYNQYLDGALDWIYHIADVQRRRAFENHIREVHTDENARKRIDEIRDSDQYDAEDAQAQIESVLAEKKNPLNNLVVELRRGTNTLAGKKSSMDRSVEADFGRWVYSTMTNVANRSRANMVAGNLASAATNVIPIVQSWTQVKPRNSFKAVKQIIQAMNNDDGLVEKSAFLTNRLLQNESLYKDAWDKIGDVVSLPMELVDKFTSQVVWRSKYIENIEKGMSEEAAIHDADQFAENVIAGRSRGNMPTIFDSKNPIYKVLTAFQLEVANQYGYFFKDVPTDTKAAMKGMTEKQKNEEKTKLAIGLTNMLLGTYVYNAAMEFITGNTPATDPIRILEGIIRDIWGEAEDDDEEETGEEIAHVAGSALEELAKELPYIGGLIGGGRISSAAAIPYGDPFKMIKGTMEDFGEGNWANLKKEWLNLVYYGVLPMGGGQIKKINEGIGMYLDPSEEFPFLPKIAETPGSYTTSGNLRYAVEPTVWNVLQSILFGQYANANAREYFDEGRSPLSPNQVEEFSSVDMSMSEYWDYRDALKAAGDKVADKIDVVMDLDLPIAQKNILANNIADRKDPIDLTGAEDFGNFAEFDFFIQHRKKYDFLKGSGVPIAQYLTMEAADKALKDYEPGSEKMQKFLKDNNLTLEKCQALQLEKETLDFRFDSGEKKYAFLISNGISVQEFEAMSKEEKDEVNMLYENPKKLEFLRGKGITAAQYKDMDKVTKQDLDYQYKNPEKYSFLQKAGISVEQYKGFDKATKDAWDTMAKNPKKYEFLKKQGVTVDRYKLFNQGWKDAWNWAYDNQDAYLVSQGVTEDIYTYRKYMDKIAGISGDKNEKGNTISGSKQKKVWAYIQTLPLSDGAKMLLFKEKYPDDDTYNKEVARYVLGLAMTYTEKKRILERLKFKVDSNGKITW